MKKISFTTCLMLFFWMSCTNDTFVPSGMDCEVDVTYDTNMKDIIDRNCAYSGCHSGTPGTPGNYVTYQGMQIHFGGEIADRVLARQNDTVFGMPPNYAEGPVDLSPEDFMLLNCWINQEFPEN